MTTPSRRPSAAELAAAADRTIPDLVGPGLRLLLVGINPGLWSAAVGRHFGNPANRLWPVLHLAGLTPRRLRPTEQDALVAAGIGVTNVAPRATRTAAELTADELRAGVRLLESKVAVWQPRVVAFLGLTAYRTAYGEPRATVGPRERTVAGARVWLLPNPSGLNAHYQLPDLVRVFAELTADLRRSEPLA